MTDYDAWAQHQQELAALEDIARAVREPAERARAEQEGREADERNDYLAARDAARTPEERAWHAKVRKDTAEMLADVARKDRTAAKAKRVKQAGTSLLVASVALVVSVIGTLVIWRYGMSQYDPKAAPSWGEAGRIVAGLAIAFATFVLVFVWLAKFFGFLGSLISRA